MANSSLSLLLLLLLCLIPSLVFSSPESSDRSQNFIIHVLKTHKPTVFTSHYDWYTSIIQSLPPSSHPSKILYTYEHAMNGFSAHLTVEQASKLRELPGVLSVIPDQIYQLQTTRTPLFLGLTDGPTPTIWSKANYGEDVIIGVLDTGIWPNHPSFSDEGYSPVPEHWTGECDFPASSCNKKLIGARAFVKGIQSYLGKPLNDSTDSTSPEDTDGHGTHVASIAAGSPVKDAKIFEFAKGEARGIASKARISVYKITSGTSVADSDMIAGFEQAISDKVHVISVSVGGRTPRPYDIEPRAFASFRASRNGIFVSFAAGNAGPVSSTVSNVAPWSITVGASTIDREFRADVVLGNGQRFTGASLSEVSLPKKSFPLVDGAGCRKESLPSDIKEKIVVCDSVSETSDVLRGEIVRIKGGAGMIVVNSEVWGEELRATAYLFPATKVTALSGEFIKQYIESDQNPTATIEFKGTVIGEPPSAPRVAAFSSRGPNKLAPEILKPDVIAPGVNILAAWSGVASPTGTKIDKRRVEFNIISGTSMACPHVSGIAAMLRKIYPKWSPAAIKSAIMTTAYNLDKSGGKIVDLSSEEEATPFALGAGHVDPNRALDPGLVYDMETGDYILFLCSINYTPEQISMITGERKKPDICKKKPKSPGDINYPSFSVVLHSNSDIVTYNRMVKNVGSNVNAVYKVKVNAPPNVNVKVSPLELKFSAEKKMLSYQITFSKGGGSLGSSIIGSQSQSFGSIEWSDGTHVVRSPIAVQMLQGSNVYI